MKLIKINTDHYVVVDDSQIKEGDWCLMFDDYGNLFLGNQPQQYLGEQAGHHLNKGLKKITHSTTTANLDVYSQTPIGLSLSEVKELIGEVNVEKKAESYAKDGLVLDTPIANGLFYGYIKGYTQALADNKEKKYTEEDMRKAFDAARRCITMPIGGAKHQYYDEYSVSDFDEYKREILSAHTPTEWEIQIVDGKLKLK